MLSTTAINFTIEILDGRFIGAAVDFLNIVNFSIVEPSRAILNTKKSFVMGFSTDRSKIEWPLNLDTHSEGFRFWCVLCAFKTRAQDNSTISKVDNDRM